MQTIQAVDGSVERLLRVVSTLVAETHPGRRRIVAPDSHLERDLGLDSLARVELVLRIGQEFGVSLPDIALAEAQTPRDLLGFLGSGNLARSAVDPVGTALVGEPCATLPEEASTLVEVLEWHVRQHADRTHVLLYADGDEALAISYGDLLAGARRIAAGLVTRGLQPRQTVALMLPTGRDYLTSFFGVMLAGGIPVPIYPPARLATIDDHLRRHSRILGNAQTVFIVTVAQAKGVAALLRGEVPSLTAILTPDELGTEPLDLLWRAAPDDIAFLQYTSGSTGDPKGVMLTHANLLANLRAMGQTIAVSSEDVFVSWLPLYHDMGLIGAWFGSLYFAMPLVLMSPLAFLARPSRWLAAISHHRGTISAAPNFAYELCARKLTEADLRGLDLSGWRLAMNGAEPVNPATLEAFASRLAAYGLRREAITPVYGLAECSVGLAFPPLNRGPRIDVIERETLAGCRLAVPAAEGDGSAMRVPACGRVLAGHEIRIIDERGVELADRRIGRLQFRGPSATTGYFRNPEATKRLFSGDWLDSGDLAYTVDGEIYLTGRVKDLIIRGGRNLYPYELEQAVGNLAGIRKGCVAVFACNDGGETGEKLVVLAETRENDEGVCEELRQRINEVAVETMGLPVDEIVLAPPNSVLKTSSGKIRRNASRDAYLGGLIGASPESGRRQALRLGIATLRAGVAERVRRGWGMAYAIWCWMLFTVFALPVVAVVSLAQSPTFGRWLMHGAARALLALSGLAVRVKVPGRMPEEPHILLVNHGSYLDALVLYAVLPAQQRYVFVAKREFVAHRVLHAFLRGLGTLFVERHAVARSAEDVGELVAALGRGEKLVIFPEGTFTREAGLRPFRMGAFVAATRAATPVLVAGLRGTRSVLRDESWLPQRGRLEFELGSFLPVNDAGDWESAVRLRDQARAEMLKLCGEHNLAH